MLARNVREDIVREEEDKEIEERWKVSRERTKYFIDNLIKYSIYILLKMSHLC